VKTRLETWIARGGNAASGVDTFYDHPSEDDRQDAVATMIHGEWMRAFITATFADEGIDFAFMPSRAEKTFRVLHSLVAGRGAGNPLELASYNTATEESAFFDVLGTDAVESSHEVILSALVTALDRLEGPDGFDTADMNQWLWGMKHHVRFKALLEEVAAGNPLAGILAFKFAINTQTLPLAPDLDPRDPRTKLENFPRPGDIFSVDVGAGGFDGPYTYSQGPVMRMVITLDGESISGRNILPGGQSGLAGNVHFADQAAMWLGNQTVPIRYHANDVVAGAAGNEKMSPPK
jgi:penicillin G amidase